ncbi:MunI family type II restriction endonuclease [Streptococcus caviae]|uniref:MunI family type II restriction endonuclease n=1 Tax=Streptococcus sp. 'caviae' TaxID=1915004 RepID=UPI00094BC552|nr:MunI family type II restriction endonuclease [Streptococcus sp. 'caviae']OLN82539.1 hypothetical protein BMI76_08725 [Streptococcus sp. 'caviae']
MASNELRGRANWQTISGGKALKTEEIFAKALQIALDGAYPGVFKVDQHPKEFGDIYSKHQLPQQTLDAIYNVSITKSNGKDYQWGISMDFAIRNLQSGKTLFGEIKRQDGWIEGGNMQDGRGNAHERSNKYFTPGLLKVIREKSGISDEILPFWVVFVGDITRDPRRNREIDFWYQGFERNYFMWRDTTDIDSLLQFFEENLLDYLL